MNQPSPHIPEPFSAVHRRRRALQRGLSVALLLLFALSLRCIPYREVFDNTRTHFYGTDPYYHMRRIFLTMAHFPHVPDFDYYVNFPGGALINWPGGFDLLLATLSLTLGTLEPSRLFVERLCALSIPIFGTLTVGVFFGIARRFLSFRQALFASFLLACSGAHILVSRVGRVDHHVMEPLISSMAIWIYLGSLDYHYRSRTGLFLSLLSGAFFAISLVFWTGSIMFVGVFLGFAFVHQALLIQRKTPEDSVTKRNLRVLLSMTVVLLPFCALSPWGRQGQILYVALSWFHFLVPFFGWLILAVLDRFRSRFVQGPRGALSYVSSAGLLALFLLFLTLAVQPESVQTLRDTWEFVTRKEIQIHSLGESRSLWVVRPQERVLFYGHLAGILPLTALYALVRVFLPKGRDPKNLILVLWFSATGLLAVLQVRFTPAFSLPLCLFWGLLLADVQRFAGWLGEKRRKPGLYRWFPFPLYMAFVLATFPNALHQPRQSIPRDHHDVFVDIGRITPETPFYDHPEKKPDYGILSHWPYGHHLNYISRRPNIANPFGQAEWYLQGVQDSYRFFLSEHEQESVSLCKELEARYVLASQMSRHLSAFSRYVSLLDPHRLKGQKPKEYLVQHYRCVMNNRLLLYDGLPATPPPGPCEDTGPLEQFRLVYESPAQEKDRITGDETSAFKLFEVVPGADLAGKAAPDHDVRISVDVQTNLKRTFPYMNVVRSDRNGDFRSRLPYATDGCETPCRPSGPYRIVDPEAGKDVCLVVHERDVMEGNAVFVDMRP